MQITMNLKNINLERIKSLTASRWSQKEDQGHPVYVADKRVGRERWPTMLPVQLLLKGSAWADSASF